MTIYRYMVCLPAGSTGMYGTMKPAIQDTGRHLYKLDSRPLSTVLLYCSVRGCSDNVWMHGVHFHIHAYIVLHYK